MLGTGSTHIPLKPVKMKHKFVDNKELESGGGGGGGSLNNMEEAD